MNCEELEKRKGMLGARIYNTLRRGGVSICDLIEHIKEHGIYVSEIGPKIANLNVRNLGPKKTAVVLKFFIDEGGFDWTQYAKLPKKKLPVDYSFNAKESMNEVNEVYKRLIAEGL